MTSTQDALPSVTSELCWIEVPREQLVQHRDQLLDALQDVCLNPAFSSSPKSCAFLQHVLLRTLSGDVDDLKERLIGMALLGRDPSYDTSSDAGVRVRANDVRKRLVKVNESGAAASGFAITLPAGSYVPRVYRVMPWQESINIELPLSLRCEEEPSAFELPTVGAIPLSGSEAPGLDLLALEPSTLSVFQLVVPTLAALFLCVICMRWQLSQEHHDPQPATGHSKTSPQ